MDVRHPARGALGPEGAGAGRAWAHVGKPGIHRFCSAPGKWRARIAKPMDAGLGRMSESQESIGFAVRLASGARELLSGRRRPRRLLFIVATIGVSQTYWRIGMACLAMVKLDDARDSFSIGRDR